MKHVLFILLYLALGRTACATPTETDIYLIIAVDDSNSMYHPTYNGEDPHAYQQAAALHQYLVSEFRMCEVVHVLYFNWATETSAVITGTVGDGEIDADLVTEIEAVKHRTLSVHGTFHWVAYTKIVELAQPLLAEGATVYALVTTDGTGESPEALNLGARVPAGIKMFVLTYGSKNIAEYGERNLLPVGGQHIHADTVDDASYAIEDIFNAIANGNCSAI
jgi:ATP:corrinoid adenosyltransferase